MDIDKEEVFDYLYALRRSGIINMFESIGWIMIEFGVSKEKATDLFHAWCDSFHGSKR